MILLYIGYHTIRRSNTVRRRADRWNCTKILSTAAGIRFVMPIEYSGIGATRVKGSGFRRMCLGGNYRHRVFWPGNRIQGNSE